MEVPSIPPWRAQRRRKMEQVELNPTSICSIFRGTIEICDRNVFPPQIFKCSGRWNRWNF